MVDVLVVVSLALLAIVILLLIVLIRRPVSDTGPVATRLDAIERGQAKAEQTVRDELGQNRLESSGQAQLLRQEVVASVKGGLDSMLKTIGEMRSEATESIGRSRDEITKALNEFKLATVSGVSAAAEVQRTQLDGFATRLTDLATAVKGGLDSLLKSTSAMRSEAADSIGRSRDEIAKSLDDFKRAVVEGVSAASQLQREQLEAFGNRLGALSTALELKLEALRAQVDQKLKDIQEDNTKKLDLMRQTVDEKLEGTLEKRLGESFKLVSDRLESVHKGLGEMQALASGVGDLKKVLTNVKTRGTWGEVQLGNLLEDMLTPDQFGKNVATKPGTNERVEFAIKLPGRDNNPDEPVWLPIDAKFPREDYERLVEAAERADAAQVADAIGALEGSIRASAKDIAEKYLNPPRTTDFGILFLPTEGLFAEVLRCLGLADSLQREFRVTIAGPTTLAAMLNALRMGFRTLAIEKRSSEVWTVLGAVKAEFGKFGQIVEKVKKKLDEASNTIDDASRRTRVMERKLRDVEELPAIDAEQVLGLASADGLKTPPLDDAAELNEA
ncbi:MAG: DNA recombination protein RmuC [Phycisphaerales bacterium]